MEIRRIGCIFVVSVLVLMAFTPLGNKEISVSSSNQYNPIKQIDANNIKSREITMESAHLQFLEEFYNPKPSVIKKEIKKANLSNELRSSILGNSDPDSDNIYFGTGAVLFSYMKTSHAFIWGKKRPLVGETIAGFHGTCAIWGSIKKETTHITFVDSPSSGHRWYFDPHIVIVLGGWTGLIKAPPNPFELGITLASLSATWVIIIPLTNFQTENNNSKVVISNFPNNYKHHKPIHIIGDNDFTPENGVVGGSGTSDDPYIIEGWEINASNGIGIYVEDTTAHFIIRNCYIHDGILNPEWPWDGITLWQVKNGAIKDCLILNNDDGISLFYSKDNTIKNVTLSYNTDGIYLLGSANNMISNCKMINQTAIGILLRLSSSNKFNNCSLAKNLMNILEILSISNIFRYCDITNSSVFGIFDFYSVMNIYNYNNICGNKEAGFLGFYTISDVRHNWWSSPDGPSGSGPGSGDAIAWIAAIICYRPWLNEPV